MMMTASFPRAAGDSWETARIAHSIHAGRLAPLVTPETILSFI